MEPKINIFKNIKDQERILLLKKAQIKFKNEEQKHPDKKGFWAVVHHKLGLIGLDRLQSLAVKEALSKTTDTIEITDCYVARIGCENTPLNI